VWTCPHCGGTRGFFFTDENLQGMLCLAPDCGRFDPTAVFPAHEVSGDELPPF